MGLNLNMNRRIRYASVMIVLILIFFACIVFSQITRNPIKSINGVMDLTNWDFERDGTISLDGQWDFSWEDEEKAYSIDVPGSWNNQSRDGVRFPVEGYGIYHLRIIAPKAGGLMALKLNRIPSAYTLYIDDKEFFTSGNPGTSFESEVPEWAIKTIYFSPAGSTIDIKLKVSNFSYGKSGLSNPILFGTAEGISDNTNKHLFVETFLFGAIFIVALLFAAIYYFGGRNRIYSSMSLFSALLSITPLLYGDVILLKILPGIPWEVFNKLFIISFGAVQFMLLFIYSSFNECISKKFVKCSIIVQNITLLAGILIPSRWIMYSEGVQRVLIIVNLCYIAYVLIKAVMHKDRWASVILISAIFLDLTFIADMLNDTHVLRFEYYYTSFGILLFIFIVFAVMAEQYKENVHINKKLKEEAELRASSLHIEKRQRLISDKLNRLARDITSTLDLDEVLDRLLNHLHEIIPFTAAYIMLKENGKLKVCAQKVMEGAGWVTEKYKYMAWNDGIEGPFFAKKPVMLETVNNGEAYTAQILPLYYSGLPLGIFEVYKPKYVSESMDDSNIIEVFADQAAIAINNARLYSTLKEYANVDSLTQAFTRRYFKELVDTIMNDLKSEGKVGSMAMFDVDHFKSINDKYGHISGDVVLKTIVRRCMDKLPDEAVISRYGGEEFIIYFPYADRQRILGIMEKCRDEIRSKPVSVKQYNINVTVSIGIIFQEQPDETLETLVRRADEVLYAAKRNGRDCICL